MCIRDSLVYNPSFEIKPYKVAAQTTTARYWDGTAGGSVTRTPYDWYVANRSGSATFTAEYDESKKAFKVAVSAQTDCQVVLRKTNNSGSGWGSTAVGHVPLKPNTTYRFECKYETDSVVTVGGQYNAFVELDELGATKNYIATNRFITVSGTNAKTHFSGEFTTNASTQSCDVFFGIDGTTGTIWVTDIFIVEV